MISIDTWMAELTIKLKDTFGPRLLFVGLQGSWRRGEATESSNIDAVVILDKLTMDDLRAYRGIIETMPKKEKACGFVSGRPELLNWPKHELFGFQNDTDALHGNLDELLPEISKDGKIPRGYEIRFNDGKNTYSKNDDWQPNTYYIAKGHYIIKQNLATEADALKWVQDFAKQRGAG